MTRSGSPQREKRPSFTRRAPQQHQVVAQLAQVERVPDRAVAGYDRRDIEIHDPVHDPDPATDVPLKGKRGDVLEGDVTRERCLTRRAGRRACRRRYRPCPGVSDRRAGRLHVGEDAVGQLPHLSTPLGYRLGHRAACSPALRRQARCPVPAYARASMAARLRSISCRSDANDSENAFTPSTSS